MLPIYVKRALTLIDQVEKGQNDEYINVVWAVEDAVPGNDGVLLARDGMSVATVYEVTGPTEPISWTIEAVSNDAGALYFPLELPGATAKPDEGIFSPYPMIGGRTYILIESREGGHAPTLDPHLVCQNGLPVAVDYRIHDGGSGYDTLAVVASPEHTYDLSWWTEPDTAYFGTINEAPPVGGTATITLTNEAGISTVQTLYNPGPSYCAVHNTSNPGGDHPDDNHSAASSPIPAGEFFALPEGARLPARVAILERGDSHELWQMVLGLGEPATRIDADFDPIATVEQYPVLLIPSGGLYGLEESISFHARLEEYADTNPKPQCPNPNVIIFTVIILRPADATLLTATGYLLTANDYADGTPLCSSFIVHLIIVHFPPPCPAYISV